MHMRLHGLAFALAWFTSACGPSAGPAVGDGSGGGGEASGTATTSDTVGTAATTEGDSSSGTSAERDCSRSDLPPPFCHELVLIGEWGGFYEAAHDDVRDGVRPVLLSDDSRFWLVDPLDPTQVFAEFSIPVELQSSGWTVPAKGDFDGDGDTDFALVSHADEAGNPLFVLDGQTLEPYAVEPMLHDGWRHEYAAIDVDGDGDDELMAIVTNQDETRLDAWALEGGTWSLVATQTVGPDCWWFPARGDFDRDGLQDLAMMWDPKCALAPSMVTMLGGSLPPEGLDVWMSPQPSFVLHTAVGDFDGDGDDEVLAEENTLKIHVMDWTAEGFVEAGTFGVDDEIRSVDSGPLVSGAYFEDQPHAVLVVGLVRHDQSGALEGYSVVIGPSAPALDPIEVPHATQGPGEYRPADDLNADGIADLQAATNGNYGYYLSIE